MCIGSILGVGNGRVTGRPIDLGCHYHSRTRTRVLSLPLVTDTKAIRFAWHSPSHWQNMPKSCLWGNCYFVCIYVWINFVDPSHVLIAVSDSSCLFHLSSQDSLSTWPSGLTPAALSLHITTRVWSTSLTLVNIFQLFLLTFPSTPFKSEHPENEMKKLSGLTWYGRPIHDYRSSKLIVNHAP